MCLIRPIDLIRLPRRSREAKAGPILSGRFLPLLRDDRIRPHLKDVLSDGSRNGFPGSPGAHSAVEHQAYPGLRESHLTG